MDASQSTANQLKGEPAFIQTFLLSSLSFSVALRDIGRCTVESHTQVRTKPKSHSSVIQQFASVLPNKPETGQAIAGTSPTETPSQHRFLISIPTTTLTVTLLHVQPANHPDLIAYRSSFKIVIVVSLRLGLRIRCRQGSGVSVLIRP